MRRFPLLASIYCETGDIHSRCYRSERDETLILCGCGRSGDLPFCDGSYAD